MSALIWAAWASEWELNSKVSFDGINKIVYVHPEVTLLDIRADVYSAWIAWVVLYDNMKFLPTIRYTGYDPIGGGQFTGDSYFLINGWKLSVNLQNVKVTGVLFSDDYPTAYYTPDLVPQYPATVSALVNTVSTGGSGASAAELWAYGDRALSVNPPTATEIRVEMDANSVKLAQIKAIMDSMVVPTASQNADAVWNKPISGMTDKTTIGGYISKVLLSIPKFLGLK
jgi:hypothetical protein